MVFPNNYLPSTSQPWGREVQKRIELAEIAISRNEKNNDARDTQLASAQDRLSAQLVQVNNVANQANQTAISAAAAAEQANSAIALANEAITTIQYILGILDTTPPPNGSGSSSGTFVGPTFEMNGDVITSVTLNAPSGATNANVSASCNIYTVSEVAGYPATGSFYLADSTTSSDTVNWAISSSAMQTNTYSQTFAKSYTGVTSVTIYVKINGGPLSWEAQSIGADLNVSVTWG